jgi:hypothetical protein
MAIVCPGIVGDFVEVHMLYLNDLHSMSSAVSSEMVFHNC